MVILRHLSSGIFVLLILARAGLKAPARRQSAVDIWILMSLSFIVCFFPYCLLLLQNMAWITCIPCWPDKLKICAKQIQRSLVIMIMVIVMVRMIPKVRRAVSCKPNLRSKKSQKSLDLCRTKVVSSNPNKKPKSLEVG